MTEETWGDFDDVLFAFECLTDEQQDALYERCIEVGLVAAEDADD